MAEITQTVPYSFDEIYTNLVEKLGNDAPYEGSNIAQLITSMSYLISMLNVNTAANINEMILPLASKRENILESARLLGYEPAKKLSFRYNITLTLSSEILESDKVIIEKYHKFTSGALSYYYMGEDTIEIYGPADTYYTFEVIEGDLKTPDNDPQLLINLGTVYDNIAQGLVSKTYIDIPYTDIEDNGIELFLTYLDDSGKTRVDEKWSQSKQFLIDKDSVLKKEFLRKDDIDFKTARVHFKYAGIGNNVSAGTIIKVYALVSKGSLGEASAPFVSSNTALADLVTLTADLVVQGADEETSASIKENAPLFFNTANRVITSLDYEAFCDRQSSILKSKIWGGDEEYPERPGEIWFSFLPKTKTRTFTPSLGNEDFLLDNKDSAVNNFLEESEILTETYDEDGNAINPGIWNILDEYKIPTMKFHNRHPVYLDFEYDISILKFRTTQSRSATYSDIFNIIDTYFKGTEVYDDVGNIAEYIEKFNVEYFNTNVIKRIDEYLTDASGFSLVLTNYINIYSKNLSKEHSDTNLANTDCFFQFGLPYEDIFDIDGKLITSRLPDITTELTINGFTGNLTVDWSDIITAAEDLHTRVLIQADIKHNNIVIGSYKIFNSVKKYISINLFVQDNTTDAIRPETQELELPTGVYLTSSLRKTHFDNGIKLNFKTFSPNFKTRKNVIPRLTRVSFN